MAKKLRITKSTIFYFFGIIAAIALVSLTMGRQVLAGRQPGLISFSIIHFAGYLFFLLMPVEALIPYYLSEAHNPILLLVLSVATALAAQLIDYSLGRFMRPQTVERIIRSKQGQKSRKAIQKYGYWAIFIFNLFPLSSPILVFVAGMLNLKLIRVVKYSSWGLLIKYALLVLFFTGLF